MIVAAGLGTRLRPLSALRPKPAMPVRGLPLVTYPLELLAHHGVRDVVINVHHLPDALIEAARRARPAGLSLEFSRERELLGTGGALRRVVGFLRASDPCVVLAGDMILDADLTALVARHRARQAAVTLVLLDDPRQASFGSIGLDAAGRVRRIARRFDLGGETAAGLYTSLTLISARALDSLPAREAFGHLDDWLAPRLAAGTQDVYGEILTPAECTWLPVGTPPEYLEANLAPRPLSFLDADARARAAGTRLEPDLVVGAGAVIGRGAALERVVVWEGERVPAGFAGHDGVFAGGGFHSCAISEGASRSGEAG